MKIQKVMEFEEVAELVIMMVVMEVVEITVVRGAAAEMRMRKRHTQYQCMCIVRKMRWEGMGDDRCFFAIFI